MYLRGQGDSPVRICEYCKTLEEAARFEMRYAHKNKSRRGASKVTSDYEDDGNESVSSNKDSVYQADGHKLDSVLQFYRDQTGSDKKEIFAAALPALLDELVCSVDVDDSVDTNISIDKKMIHSDDISLQIQATKRIQMLINMNHYIVSSNS